MKSSAVGMVDRPASGRAGSSAVGGQLLGFKHGTMTNACGCLTGEFEGPTFALPFDEQVSFFLAGAERATWFRHP